MKGVARPPNNAKAKEWAFVNKAKGYVLEGKNLRQLIRDNLHMFDGEKIKTIASGLQKLTTPAQQRRLDAIDDPLWIDAMVKLLARENWFRWFDSGDLQSLQMLHNIAEVARRTPHCRHWLATRERLFVSKFLKLSVVPDNLCIRVSATFPDVPVKPITGVNAGNVHYKQPPVGQPCPAPQQNGKCETCRACWDKGVLTVSYKEH